MNMGIYTEEEINNIIDLRGYDGKQINIFKLHGILFIGNPENGKWDLTKSYTRLSEHAIPISLEDFEDCKNEEDVREAFSEELKNMIIEKLL